MSVKLEYARREIARLTTRLAGGGILNVRILALNVQEVFTSQTRYKFCEKTSYTRVCDNNVCLGWGIVQHIRSRRKLQVMHRGVLRGNITELRNKCFPYHYKVYRLFSCDSLDV